MRAPAGRDFEGVLLVEGIEVRLAVLLVLDLKDDQLVAGIAELAVGDVVESLDTAGTHDTVTTSRG